MVRTHQFIKRVVYNKFEEDAEVDDKADGAPVTKFVKNANFGCRRRNAGKRARKGEPDTIAFSNSDVEIILVVRTT